MAAGHKWKDITEEYTVTQVKFFYSEITIQGAEKRASDIENILIGAQGTSEVVDSTTATFRKIRSEA